MKYKKSIFAILTLLFLQFCCYPLSWSFPNEPSGFHGVPWGSLINHGPEMIYKKDINNIRMYVRRKEINQIEGVPVSRIQYGYNPEGKLFLVGVDLPEENFPDLKDRLFQKYGNVSPDEPGKYVWESESTLIRFQFNEKKNMGELAYVYKPLLNTLKKKSDKNKDFFKIIEIVMKILSTLGLIAVVVAGSIYRKKRERKEIPDPPAWKNEREKRESHYRKYLYGAYAIAGFLLLLPISAELLIKGFFPGFSGIMGRPDNNYIGLIAISLMGGIIFLAGAIITRYFPSDYISQLKTRALFSLVVPIALGFVGLQVVYMMGNPTLTYLSCIIGILFLYTFFPRKEKWENLAGNHQRYRTSPASVTDEDISARLKRCVKTQGNQLRLLLVDSRLIKRAFYPLLVLMIVAIAVISYRMYTQIQTTGQLGDFRHILLILLGIPIIILPVVIMFFFRKGIVFDRDRQTMNEYFQLFSIKKDNITDLTEFDRLKLQRLSMGHAFEICLDREDSRKIVWWTSNEKDARWLVKKLSGFLKMEWVDNA
jgi:hypothetical protein